jgi:hypothetical protein
MKSKKWIIFTAVLILMLMVSGCQPDDGDNDNDNGNGNGNGNGDNDILWKAEELFPLKANVKYQFEGEGNEFATFDVVIDYLEEDLIQRRMDNGGTQTVDVIHVATGVVERVFRQGEVYYRENMLKKTGEREVLIMDPIKVGTQWSVLQDGTRTITKVGEKITTPMGEFETVEITVEYSDENVGVVKEYYAKDVGLVKLTFQSEGEEITSTLSQVVEGEAVIQNVPFYYPKADGNSLEYVLKPMAFMTNQVTRTTLEETYKKDAPFAVLSAGTRINSLYLNADGMVYIDVNKAFVDEMNVGAGYEAMVLQSLANTIGSYYGVEKVLLTVDNGLYESGHIALARGEYLEVDLGNAQPRP